MVVYADVLFAVNFVSLYLLLYLLAVFIVKTKVKKLRFCAASAFGALCAAAVFTDCLPAPILTVLRVLSAPLCVFTAFYDQKRQFLAQLLHLAALSVFIAGTTVVSASLLSRGSGAIMRSGIIYIDLPEKIFLPLFAVSYVLAAIFMRYVKRKQSEKRLLITIAYGGKTITVPALFDSGNLLREPVTGRGVSILEWSVAKKLLGAECELCDIGGLMPKLRLWAVPYKSLGKKNGIIFAFIADSISVPEEKRVVPRAFVGLYGGKLGNGYSALVNSELF